MVTGTFKNKIDHLWNIFATGGLVNPLDVIEQITYLLFIKDLDKVDTENAKSSLMLDTKYTSIFPADKQNCKWSNFIHFPSVKMYETMQNKVFPFIKNLHSDKNSTYAKYMADAIFKIPTPQLLDKIISCIEEIDWADKDARGDIYEYLLSKIATSGRNGQFRTPRHIIKMMVELVHPQPDDIICDPACGTSGFLVAAGEYLKENYGKQIFYKKPSLDHYNNTMFYGYDMDRTMLRIGAMNMMTHGISNPNILYKDSLSENNDDTSKFTLILANPPFKGSLAEDTVAPNLLKVTKTKKTELLFLALMLRMLKSGGRCAVIVPDGVLFGSSNAHKAIRKELIENNSLQAVISMPSGVFKPYAGVSTAVLIFTKDIGGTKQVWFYDMQADGFSLDDKRDAIQDNDIPDILTRFKNLKEEAKRKRTDKSFFVPVKEIRDNGYDLSINKYKQIVYVPEEYPAPKTLFADIIKLEKDITTGIKELEGLLK